MRVIKLQLGPLNTNCYIIHGENDKKAAVIDPACYAGVIKKSLKDMGWFWIRYFLHTRISII